MVLKMNAAMLVSLVLALPLSAFAQDPAKAKAGERIYRNYCATCHGDDMVNTGTSTFDLRRLRADEWPRFENSVTSGKNQMPPWKGVISPDDMELIWNYVRTNAYNK
jgi:mono/diheme cytochrome c family protein